MQEKDEYVENILSDIAALGLKYDKLTYTSDYFDLMLELAPKLIKAGKIYADDTPLLQMREVSSWLCALCLSLPLSESLESSSIGCNGSSAGMGQQSPTVQTGQPPVSLDKHAGQTARLKCLPLKLLLV